MEIEQETYSPFHMAQCMGSLRLVITTVRKHWRGSILKLVQRQYGVKSKTKKGALDEMLTLYKQVTGRDYGS